jgi:hypothetical protein
MRLRLNGACEKLDRALVHLNTLGDEMAALDEMARSNLAVADEERYPGPSGTRVVFFIGRGITPASPRVSLIAGDYIQNLRAALDHLAWEFVRRGAEPEKARGRKSASIQFPIYGVGRSSNKKRPTFARGVGERLPGITQAQRSFVDSYQPYHRGKWQLLTLANLSNQDKHRILTPVRRLAGGVTPTWLDCTGGTILAWRQVLEEGRRVDRRTPFLEVMVDRQDAEVQMHAYVSIPVALQERSGRVYRIPDLVIIGETVAEIVGESALRWGSPDDASRALSWPGRARNAVGL